MLRRSFVFTQDWFTGHAWFWKKLLQQDQPSRFLEIGCYEGRATCFVIKQCAAHRNIEFHCVDTWQGSVEHDHGGMEEVEARFDENVALARALATYQVDFHKHKAPSSEALPRLLAEGAGEHFDWIYVDGSHQAPDVLTDAVLAFMLLRPGGLLIFDDYLWMMDSVGGQDFYQLPKPAIDAFVNIFQLKVTVLPAYLYQLFVRKMVPDP